MAQLSKSKSFDALDDSGHGYTSHYTNHTSGPSGPRPKSRIRSSVYKTGEQLAFSNQDKKLELSFQKRTKRFQNKEIYEDVAGQEGGSPAVSTHESLFQALTYPIPSMNQHYHIWLDLMIAQSMISIFIQPYRLSFMAKNPSTVITAISVIITVLFCINEVLHMFYIVPPTLLNEFYGEDFHEEPARTSLLPGRSLLQYRWMLIKYYWSTPRLVIGFVATMPWDYFGEWIKLAVTGEHLSIETRFLLGSFRCLRLLFVLESFTKFEKNVRFPYASIRSFKFLYMFVLNAQWFSCLFFFLAITDPTYESTWLYLHFPDLTLAADKDLYLLTLYYSVTTMSTVGYGDTTPGNNREYILAILYMVSNMFLTAWVLGNMTILITQADEKTRQFRIKFQDLEHYLESNQFPEDVGNSMRSYLILQFTASKEHREIVDEFPAVFKTKVNRILYRPIIGSSFFADVASHPFLDSLCCMLTLEVLMPGTDAVSQYDASLEMFLVVSGSLDILIEEYVDDEEETLLLLDESAAPKIGRSDTSDMSSLSVTDDTSRRRLRKGSMSNSPGIPSSPGSPAYMRRRTDSYAVPPTDADGGKHTSYYQRFLQKTTGTESSVQKEYEEKKRTLQEKIQKVVEPVAPIRLEEQKTLMVSTMEQGDCFGEVPFFFGLMQPFTIRTTSISRLLVLKHKDWETLKTLYPNDSRMVLQEVALNINFVAQHYMQVVDGKEVSEKAVQQPPNIAKKYKNIAERSSNGASVKVRRSSSCSNILSANISDIDTKYKEDIKQSQSSAFDEQNEPGNEGGKSLNKRAEKRHSISPEKEKVKRSSVAEQLGVNSAKSVPLENRVQRVHSHSGLDELAALNTFDVSEIRKSFYEKSEETKSTAPSSAASQLFSEVLVDKDKDEDKEKEKVTFSIFPVPPRQSASSASSPTRPNTAAYPNAYPMQENLLKKEKPLVQKEKPPVQKEKPQAPVPKQKPKSSTLDKALKDVYTSMMEAVNAAILNLQQAKVQELCFAAASGNIYVMKQIVTSGFDVDSCDYDDRTALLIAASKGVQAAVKYLITVDANINCKDSGGMTPLFEAVKNGHEEVAEELFAAGAVLGFGKAGIQENMADPILAGKDNGSDYVGTSMYKQNDPGSFMGLLIKRGDVKLLERLLRFGMDPNIVDYNGRSGLHFASTHGSDEGVMVLLHHGANPSAIDNFGRSPLLEAVRARQEPAARILFKHGAELGLLQTAVERKVSNQVQKDAAMAQLGEGVNENYRRKSYSHLSVQVEIGLQSRIMAGLELCLAVYENDCHYVRLLLEFGCPINATDYDLRTAAHLACSEGSLQMALLLFEYGADFVSIKDRWGHTPLDEALLAHHKDLAEAVKSLIMAKKREITRKDKQNTFTAQGGTQQQFADV